MNPFRPWLERQGVVVLDGGLATDLEARGHDLSGGLWSARLLGDRPEAVRESHARYLRAGADCVVTASYQASFAGFSEAGISVRDGERLLRRSTELALEAREEVGRVHGIEPQPLVAASVGPYGAYLADGSEYDGRYGVDGDTLERFHRRRWDVLAVSGADVLACETIPSVTETQVLLDLSESTPEMAIWMSWTCVDGRRLRDGTPVEVAVRLCQGHESVAAVGVNCTDPRFVPELVSRIGEVTDVPVLVYPNSGERYDAVSGAWSAAADSGFDDPRSAGEGPAAERAIWLDAMLEARAAGARLLGGCCRIGPDDIRELRTRLLRPDTPVLAPESSAGDEPPEGGRS